MMLRSSVFEQRQPCGGIGEMSDDGIAGGKRREHARRVIEEFSDKISPLVQKKILEQQVILGMSPYEAHLAAGAFHFKVEADQKKWPNDADPYRVMWAQSTAPDDSKIWMTFETSTQYSDSGTTTFRVFFERGKAVKIDIVTAAR